MNKERFLSCFARAGVFYALWAAISISVSCWVFSIRLAPKENEKIQFFFSGYTDDSEALANFLDAKKPTYVKETDYRFIRTDDSAFSDYYDTFGRSSADVLILPQAEINDNKCLYDFLRFDEAVAAGIFGSVDYYHVAGNAYGIKVYDSQLGKGWATSLFAYTKTGVESQDYYLFFRRNSLHSGALGNQTLDGALTYCQALEAL
jgi:hypothetical protein